MPSHPDVVVIGAGIVGAAIAAELAERGARVRVIDRRRPGLGATQASAGVLAPFIEARPEAPLFSLGRRSLELWPPFLEHLARATSRPLVAERHGTLEVAFDTPGLSRLSRSSRALNAAGVTARLVNGQEARELEPALSAAVAGGLEIDRHGFVSARDVTAALVALAESRGAIFHDTTQAIRVIEDHGLTVETTRENWGAPWVVLAAGSWAGRVQLPHVRALPVKPIRGQLLALRFPHRAGRRVLWGPRCYLVPWPDGQLLVGATVEDVGFAEHPTVAGVQQLLAAVTELLPDAPRAQFDGVRVGLRPATPDELPILGPSERVPGLVYATGHYRNGVLLAPLTAAAVATYIIDGRSDPVFELTRPRRFGGL